MYFDNNRHIDEYFRNHLKDYSQVPDNSVWDKIESRLSHDSKMRKIFVFRTAAIALLILGLSVFLALEVSNFAPASTNFSSSAFDKELSLSETETEPRYSRINDYEGVVFSSKDETSDISVPKDILYEESIQTPNNQLQKNSSLHEESLAKLTSLREPMKLKKEDKSNAELNRSISDNFYFAASTAGQFQNITFSQETYKTSKFSLSGSFSPILSYRHSKIKNTNNTPPVENSLLSYSGGMDVSYNLAEKLSFRTGMHYTKFGQSLNNVEVTSDSYTMKGENTTIKISSSMGQGQLRFEEFIDNQLDGTPDYITYDNGRPPEFTVETAIYQTFETVKMPFLLEYTFLDEKFNFSMIGGLNANLLVNEGIYMEQAQGTKQVGSTKNLNSISYSGTLGVGLEYDITPKAQLFMEPSFDYYITSLISDKSYQTFPYFFGFFSGVSISF